MLCLPPRPLLLLLLSSPALAQVDPFAPYTSCKLPDGLSVVETAPLAPGVHSRSINTLHGPQTVALEEGRRVMFAYPEEDFYANVKVERLPAASYADEKKLLIEDHSHTLASGDNQRNYTLKPRLNGFEIYGFDRPKLEGGVLGLYLFFDEPKHTVVTIYFLNQDPHKHFSTMAEYAGLRDSFLSKYTACLAAK